MAVNLYPRRRFVPDARRRCSAITVVKRSSHVSTSMSSTAATTASASTSACIARAAGPIPPRSVIGIPTTIVVASRSRAAATMAR